MFLMAEYEKFLEPKNSYTRIVESDFSVYAKLNTYLCCLLLLIILSMEGFETFMLLNSWRSEQQKQQLLSTESDSDAH